MSKRKHQKRKLKALIQKRLHEIQLQTTNQTKPTLPKLEIAKNQGIPQESNKKKDFKKINISPKESKKHIELSPDFKKISIVSSILAILIGITFIVNIKTQILNNLASKLFTIFQNS